MSERSLSPTQNDRRRTNYRRRRSSRSPERRRRQLSRSNSRERYSRGRKERDSTRFSSKPEKKTASVEYEEDDTLPMIEIVVNDRLGKKMRIKCSQEDTVGDLKKLIAVQTGTRPEKIRLQKWYNIFKDPIKLSDYEIHDGMSLELYYN